MSITRKQNFPITIYTITYSFFDVCGRGLQIFTCGFCLWEISTWQHLAYTLKVENFAGTKFCGFRRFRRQTRNLIPAKPLTLPIRKI